MNVQEQEELAAKSAEAAKKREEYCAGLEALAQFLRTRPELTLPSQTSFVEYTWHKETLIAFAKRLGHADKEYNEYYAIVCKNFGPIKYGMQIARENVCERRVVGKKTVPFREAYLVQAEPEHEEDVVEWDCKPLLAEDESA